MQHRATMAVGLFDDPMKAWEALHELRSAGFTAEQIGVAALQAPEAEGQELTPAAHMHRIHVDETTGILAGGEDGGRQRNEL